MNEIQQYDNPDFTHSNVDSARAFFTIISKTKKYFNYNDISFYFDYYPNERANEIEILEMLEDEFHIKGATQFSEIQVENKKKRESITENEIIINLFRKDTVLCIQKCINNYKNGTSEYSECTDDLYEFLKLDGMNTVQKFSEEMSLLKNNTDDAMVHIYNDMYELSLKKDVKDNFEEFKLLVKYPALTPYMYEAEIIDESALEVLFNIAHEKYDFCALEEFNAEYFSQVYDNFNINIVPIQEMLKSNGENKFFSNLSKIMGFRATSRMPGKVNAIHWLLYWPIAMLLALIELIYTVTKFATKSIARNFFPLLAIEVVAFPLFLHQDTLLTLFWLPSMLDNFERQLGGSVEINIFTFIPLLVVDYAGQAITYIVPALFIALMLYYGGRGFYKRFDWVGIERTFQNAFGRLSAKTNKEYSEIKEGIVVKYIPGAVVNMICFVLVLIWIIS